MTKENEQKEEAQASPLATNVFTRKTQAKSDSLKQHLEQLKEEEAQSKDSEEEQQPADAKANDSTSLNDDEEKGGWKDRYSNLRRHSQQKEQASNSRIEELEAQVNNLSEGSNEAKTNIPSTPEELETFKTDNPDLYNVFEALVKQNVNESTESVTSEIAELKKAKAESDISAAHAKVLKAHPDADEVTSSDDIVKWLDSKPKAISKNYEDILYNSTDHASMASVISQFKSETDYGKPTKKTKKKEDTLDASKNVSSKRTTIDPNAGQDADNTISESYVTSLSSKEAKEQMSEIKAAQREGRFIYDLSGSR